ncbi:MAG: hypothetical protein ACRENI_00415, partial [Gemmatimonadaceae bacterium]
CQLRASDADRQAAAVAPFGRLRKRGECDKEGVEQWVPLSAAGRSAIDRIFELNPCVGDMPLFPAPVARATDRPKPWSRFHARTLLGRAEKKAGLLPLEGSDFHAYRRAWATERKHLPAQDVAAAGGWRDLRCLQTAYTHADDETILAVVTEPRKLRDAKGPATVPATVTATVTATVAATVAAAGKLAVKAAAS